jgi:uncharacterized damage-inducible protein DinB
MSTNWTKPLPSDLNSYQKSYSDLVSEGDLPAILENNSLAAVKLFSALTPEKLKYRYAPGKWSIPQLLVHIIDTERIFSYRILCVARGDKTPLPGYEENDYAAACNADDREFKDIIEEYVNVRRSSVSLLKSLTNKMLDNRGISNNKDTSVRVLCYVLAGHEIHHLNVIKEKYLK